MSNITHRAMSVRTTLTGGRPSDLTSSISDFFSSFKHCTASAKAGRASSRSL